MENVDTVLSFMETTKQTLNYTDLLEHFCAVKKKDAMKIMGVEKKENQS